MSRCALYGVPLRALLREKTQRFRSLLAKTYELHTHFLSFHRHSRFSKRKARSLEDIPSLNSQIHVAVGTYEKLCLVLRTLIRDTVEFAKAWEKKQRQKALKAASKASGSTSISGSVAQTPRTERLLEEEERARHGLAHHISSIFIDEAHYIYNKDRGYKLEMLLHTVMQVQRRFFPRARPITVVAFSATMEFSHIAKWLNAPQPVTVAENFLFFEKLHRVPAKRSRQQQQQQTILRLLPSQDVAQYCQDPKQCATRSYRFHQTPKTVQLQDVAAHVAVDALIANPLSGCVIVFCPNLSLCQDVATRIDALLLQLVQSLSDTERAKVKEISERRVHFIRQKYFERFRDIRRYKAQVSEQTSTQSSQTLPETTPLASSPLRHAQRLAHIACSLPPTTPVLRRHLKALCLGEEHVDMRHQLPLHNGFGVAQYTAGLSKQDRKLLEDLFRKRHLRCIVATSALAEGVNLPASRVVVLKTEAARFFDSTKVRQMLGRAGRLGLQKTKSEAYVLSARPCLDLMKQLCQMSKVDSPQSALIKRDVKPDDIGNVGLVLFDAVCFGLVSNEQEEEAHFESTLFVAACDDDGAKKRRISQLRQRRRRARELLRRMGVITAEHEVTKLGDAAFFSGLEPDEAELLIKDIARMDRVLVCGRAERRSCSSCRCACRCGRPTWSGRLVS
ncbi:MAG: hypothetical protein MHM6MM_006601 [Cercozoa sp. M6MM]